jgi:hypothetical protein
MTRLIVAAAFLTAISACTSRESDYWGAISN